MQIASCRDLRCCKVPTRSSEVFLRGGGDTICKSVAAVEPGREGGQEKIVVLD